MFKDGDEFETSAGRFVVSNGLPVLSKRADGLTPTTEVLNQFFGQSPIRSKKTNEPEFDRSKVWRDGW